MKFNKWTMGLAAVGVVSLASAARADETKMDKVNTALSNTTLSGYVDVAAVFNPGGIGGGGYTYSGYDSYSRNVGYYSFAKANGFYLNSVDLALDKPQDEGPWASGYHVELMVGPDATPASYTGNDGTTILRQAYLALRTPVGNSQIDWKVGVFDTIIGYESSTDGANPNYTRSYGYTMAPTTDTGILGTFKANDEISLSAGIADTTYGGVYNSYWNNDRQGYTPGVNSGVNSGAMNYPTLMGAIALTAPDSWGWAKGATLNLGIINSAGTTSGGNYNSSYYTLHGTGGGATSYYAGVTVPTPLTALKVGASFDYLDMHNATGNGYNNGYLNPANDSTWDIALYANYQYNDKLSFNLRGEYLDQSNLGNGYNSYYYGYGNGALVPYIPQTGSPYYAPPNVEEVTATVQYQLWANVLSRVEFRWDHAEHGTPFGYSTYNYSYNSYYGYGSGGTANAFTLALNLIYQF